MKISAMKISRLWMGIIAIVAGILVLAFPHLLQWIVGLFLIVIGILAIVRK